jgi:phospholipase C
MPAIGQSSFSLLQNSIHMPSRRDFLKQASLLSAGTGMLNILPESITKAMMIDPDAGTSFYDAEHIVFLMQENRSFDHTFGTMQGVRGFNDPRVIPLPDGLPVWYQADKKGNVFAPFRLDIHNTNATWMESLPHAWADQVDARNDGRYDRWLHVKPSHIEEYRDMPLTMGCYTREDIPFYYSLADAFTVCDHNFCSSLTGTTPNRLYFWTGKIREKDDAIARVWNSDADENTLVNWTTFPERLEEKGISWKIYQNEITTGSGLKDKHDSWLGNFGDNSIEYFSQFNVRASVDSLKGVSRSLRERAFTINSGDPNYRELTSLVYNDNNVKREVLVPKGDILFQFREDVKNKALPTVSWLVAPQEFSDHPSSAWYGAWYISEVMNILTADPGVWKKTIFILTYDENDGYFDHMPPFVAPHPQRQNTGKTSAGIDLNTEYVQSAAEQSSPKDAVRESPIGLGYRVPMVIASPWSRGGWVNSQVFDHTSSLMFLEKFLSKKTGMRIFEPNISSWRRTICGDLSSTFRPYNGEKLTNPVFLERDAFVESIHRASFKNKPSNFRKLNSEEIIAARKREGAFMPAQEEGIRDSNFLPYELYADCRVTPTSADLTFKAGKGMFGDNAAGSPFNVYCMRDFEGKPGHNRSYAVAAGDSVSDSWKIDAFDKNTYHLAVFGPNGFYREFRGNKEGISLNVSVTYSKKGGRGLQINMSNDGKSALIVHVDCHTYEKTKRKTKIASGGKAELQISANKHHGWYDFSIYVEGDDDFRYTYAGRVENGRPSKTDPLMGKAL